ncbi:MAG TPA: aspartate ammonia-lyase [Blastocatellia bacterium]|nr:aspartate ammonia-lyase [Blastocatellia bacterium]
MSPSNAKRVERDSLGEREVPADAYYGIQTLRAVENFPISGWRPYPSLVKATVQIKKAAARANATLGVLDSRIAEAIVTAADEMLSGEMSDQFVVDPFQAGAGTSHNMNANEVLANRAIELLGGERGDYSKVHPNDHVNMGQSTNDVFPTAMRLASIELAGSLIKELDLLAVSFNARSREFDQIVKSGRTHLQDAVPIRLGQEFGGYAAAIAKDSKRLARSVSGLRKIGLGGTAVGTGLNAAAGYKARVVDELKSITRYELEAADNYFEAMHSMAPFADLSGALKTAATDISRIANDLRLLSSGPHTGFAEIKLPAVQPGSSIMPGKVNPSIAEMVNMVCFQVMGNDVTITLAAQAGQLELNVMMPVIAFDLLMSLMILTNAVTAFRTRCVDGITADQERCRWYAEHSVSLVTALSPRIGYARAAEIAKLAMARKKTIRQVVEEEGLMSSDELDRVFDSSSLTEHQKN